LKISDIYISGTFEMGHCGLVAAFADRLGLVEFIDRHLPGAAEGKASFGHLAKGLVIQMLKSEYLSLRLGGEVFGALPIELLLGPEVRREQMNDERIGALLQAIGEYGVQRLYNEFAGECLLPLLPQHINLHGSVVNFLVSMQEAGVALEIIPSEEASLEAEEIAFLTDAISRRYSFRMAVDGSGAPLFMMPFCDYCDYTRPAYYVGTLDLAARSLSTQRNNMLFGMADASYYTSARFGDIAYTWLARVPEKVEEAGRLMNTNDALLPSSDPDCSLLETLVACGNEEHRWILVESEAAAEKQAAKSMDRIMEKRLREIQKAAAKLCKVDFSTDEDALAASNDFFSEYPEIEGLFGVNAVSKRKKKGSKSEDSETVYRLECELNLHCDAEEIIRSKLGRFILATNALGTGAPCAEELLALYNRQWRFARGMRFLTGRRLFFDNPGCLETEQQVGGIVFLLLVALALYNFGESELRRVLSESGKKLLDSRGTVVKNPGLKDLFSLFNRISIIVATAGKESAVSMSEPDNQALRILSLLGEEFKRYYAINPKSREKVHAALKNLLRS
jgi:hypothetical protein